MGVDRGLAGIWVGDPVISARRGLGQLPVIRQAGAIGIGKMAPAVSFYLPLNDLGAGAVNTTPVFAGGSPTATFTRASVKWTKLSTGLWASVASGTAAGRYLGDDTAVNTTWGSYWCEGAGTQLITPTASIRGMNDASWVKVGITVPAPNAVGIDGVANSASTLTAGGAVTNTIVQTLTAAGSSRTYSVFLKRVTGTGTIKLVQDPTLGTLGPDISGSLNTLTFTRVSLTANVLNAAVGIVMGTQNDVIVADFNQFEAGGFATSPMATAGAARNADLLTFATAGNLGDAIGSVYAEVTAPFGLGVGMPASPVIIGTNIGGTEGAPLYVTSTANTGDLSFYDGTAECFGNVFTPSSSVVQKVASTWGGSVANTYITGVASSNLTFDGTLGPSANFAIGSEVNGVSTWWGTIRNVKIWPVALSVAQIASL